jgi:opacity protein-like surface antigen
MKPLRLEGSFTYFFPKGASASDGFASADVKWNMWDISVNAHWLFPIANKITVYPLAGLGILGVSGGAEADLGEWGSYSTSASTANFGLNVGGGIDFGLTEKLFLNAEVKYKICDWGRFLLSAGLAYKF